MEQTLNPDLAALQRMTASELRVRYAELFGEQPATWNRVWMLSVSPRAASIGRGRTLRTAPNDSPKKSPTTPIYA